MLFQMLLEIFKKHRIPTIQIKDEYFKALEIKPPLKGWG